MTNKTDDTAAMFDSMDDYAAEYGDQELIIIMKLWLDRKMGGKWDVINKDAAIRCEMFTAKLNLLSKLSHELSELSRQKVQETWQYHSALTDAMILIMKEMQEL